MLSRVADSLYWMSRYLERAEHTTRREQDDGPQRRQLGGRLAALRQHVRHDRGPGRVRDEKSRPRAAQRCRNRVLPDVVVRSLLARHVREVDAKALAQRAAERVGEHLVRCVGAVAGAPDEQDIDARSSHGRFAFESPSRRSNRGAC